MQRTWGGGCPWRLGRLLQGTEWVAGMVCPRPRAAGGERGCQASPAPREACRLDSVDRSPNLSLNRVLNPSPGGWGEALGLSWRHMHLCWRNWGGCEDDCQRDQSIATGVWVSALYHQWGFQKPPHPPHGSFHLPASQGSPFSSPPIVFDLNQVGGTSQLPLANHLKGMLSHDSQTQSNDLLAAPVPYRHL